MFHRISHFFGNYTGRVVTWMEEDDIYVGFECDVCGKIDPKTVDKVPSSLVLGNISNIDPIEEI